MKLNLVLLIVGIHFITLTRQQNGLLNLTVKKKCTAQELDKRTRLIQYYDQLCGITTTTTTTTTTSTTSTTTTTTTTTTPCGVPDTALSPLYQLYNPTIVDHFYTSSPAEAAMAQALYGYLQLTPPGKITLSQTCTCGQLLVPVYRLYSADQTNHFYTTSTNDVTIALAAGYVLEGTEWYCSLIKGLCGATEALESYFNLLNPDSIYVTDPSELDGLVVSYAGRLCYIWPS